MQVNLLKKDAISSEDFFVKEKKLVLHLVDKHKQSVKFKIYSKRDDFDNYLIKCRGCYRGGYVATYKLLKSIGPLDELYSVVAEHLLRTIAGVYERDKEVIASLPRFNRHILTTDRIY